MDINIVKLKKYASTCSVLYVEDDELIRTQTESFLGRFFPDVVVAQDGEIGLQKFKERSFDVVVTDINMPNMNGIDMIEAIKEIKYEQIVLVTSAYNDSEYLMRLINLNVMRFVLKPFNNKQFLYVLYKIAEELSFTKEQVKLQNEVISLSKKAQTIVDQVKVGIVVIKNSEIEIANKAFLEIGDFDTFETLLLEMPEIGVLFEEAEHCVSATSNSDLINQLKTLSEEDRKVRILKNSKTFEYQVNLTKIEDEDSYILTFSDITAIHNALYLDQITKLPAKNFTLEKIEILKQKMSSMNVILMSISHLENVTKWYGKKEAVNLEIEFATNLKAIKNEFMPEAFLGYFGHNKFILIPNSENFEEIHNELKNMNKHSLFILDNHKSSEVDFTISNIIKLEKLDTNSGLAKIEIDIENAFDLM